jgi:hypothetical protein
MSSEQRDELRANNQCFLCEQRGHLAKDYPTCSTTQRPGIQAAPVDLHQLQSLDDNKHCQHQLQICCIQWEVYQETGGLLNNPIHIQGIYVNDEPQAFYDSQWMILALATEKDEHTDLISQYVAIPWSENPREETVLVVDLRKQTIYLIPMLRFIQEEFDLVAWVQFEDTWKIPEDFGDEDVMV